MRSLLSFVWKTTSWSFPLETLKPINCEEKARTMLYNITYVDVSLLLARLVLSSPRCHIRSQCLPLPQSSGQRQCAGPQYSSHKLKKSRWNTSGFLEVNSLKGARKFYHLDRVHSQQLLPEAARSRVTVVSFCLTSTTSAPTKECTRWISNSQSFLPPKPHTEWHRVVHWQSHKPAFFFFFLFKGNEQSSWVWPTTNFKFTYAVLGMQWYPDNVRMKFTESLNILMKNTSRKPRKAMIIPVFRHGLRSCCSDKIKRCGVLVWWFGVFFVLFFCLSSNCYFAH